MPPPYDFTPIGISAMQADLYALEDPDLLTQAQLIAADIYAWLLINFNLTTKQKNYIGGAPASVRFYWGAQIAAAVIGRTLITMGAVPDYGPPRRTKQIGLDTGGGHTYFPPVTGSGGLAGSATVSISYVLVD